MSNNKTEEEKNRDFITEYGELVAKHKRDFAHYPLFVPDGTGAFKVVLQSTPVDVTPKEEKFVAE